MKTQKVLFLHGELVYTKDAGAFANKFGEPLTDYLSRHQSGDYGKISTTQTHLNRLAIRDHCMSVVSSYELEGGYILRIVTHLDTKRTIFSLQKQSN